MFDHINETDVVLVELHSLDAKYKRLPDRFIQETVELLRETVITRFSLSQKKNVQQKCNKESSGILTGTNVRIGYSFKNRPGHQICACYDEDQSHLKVTAEKLVVFVQLLATGSPKGMSQGLKSGIDWEFFTKHIRAEFNPLLDDTILDVQIKRSCRQQFKDDFCTMSHYKAQKYDEINFCTWGLSDQLSDMKKILKLLRRLSDVKHSGPGVSISSYFQKMSSSQTGSGVKGTLQGNTSSQTQESDNKGPSQGDMSQPQSTAQDSGCSTSPVNSNKRCENGSELSKSNDPPTSEGRRIKIKSILGRYHFPGKKKKRLHADRVTNLEDQDSCDSVNSNASDSVKNSDSTSVCKSVEDAEVLEKDFCVRQIEDVNENYNRVSEKESSSDDIRISEKETYSADDILGLDLNSKSCSITVDTNINESHTFTLRKVTPQNFRNISETSGLPCNVKRVSIENICTITPNKSLEDDKGVQGSKDKDELHKRKAVGKNVVHEETPPDRNDQRSSSSDTSPLPSASFCYIKSNKRFSQIYGDALRDILNKVDNKKENDFTEPGSPVFKGTTESNKPDQDLEDVENIPESFSGVTNTAVNENNKKPQRRRLRKFKRKLPKFSDSDSEDSLPNIKRQNTGQIASTAISTNSSSQQQKITNVKKDCKKLQISKDFFTESKPKSQPKLTFFAKNTIGTFQEQVLNPAGREKGMKERAENVLKGTEEDFPNLDTELIEELSDIPRIKSEADLELLREVRSLSGVEELNEEQIRFLIRRNETLLRQIFGGKAKCERHEAYKAGGKTRRDLIYASRLGPYTDEQIDVVMEYLLSVFCKKHHKYFDYVMKVLLPEMLIQFHMEVHNTSHEESDRLLGPKSPEPIPIL